MSKSFAWTGGRIGYIIAPSMAEADTFKNMNINYFSCVPPYNQEGARVALEHPDSPEWMARMARTFEQRRDVILEKINRIDGVTCQKPGGAFYLFPNIEGLCKQLGVFDGFHQLPGELRRQTSPSTLFQMFALYKHKVAVMDRRSFGVLGAEDKHFLRLSIAADMEMLKEGVDRIAAAGRDAAGFAQFLEQRQNLY